MSRATQSLLRASLKHCKGQSTNTFRTRPQYEPFGCCWVSGGISLAPRSFHVTSRWRKNDFESKAKELNQKGLDDQEKHDEVEYDGQIDEKIGEAKELQQRTPWHREGADKPPVRRMRSSGAMTKGLKLHVWSL